MKKRYEVLINHRDENISLENGKYKLNASAFSYESTSHWLCYIEAYSSLENHYNDLGIQNYVGKSKFTVQDKILYRYPNLDLPRQKVDLLKDKYNAKITRDIEKADISIISDKYLNKLFNRTWNNSSPFENFFNIIESLKKNDLISINGLDKVEDILNLIPHNSMVSCTAPYRYNDHNNRSISSFIDNVENVISTNSKGRSKMRDLTIDNNKVNDYLKIINNSTNVIFDTDVINIIDDELAILENTEYDTILSMINSSDRDNRSLALEMIANCNIEKSFDIVSGIFFWKYDWLKDTSNWNSVNIKSLRKRMVKYQGGQQLSAIWPHDRYIQNLIDDNKLTKFALNKTRESLYKHVLCGLVGDKAEIFNVSLDNLKIKKEFEDKIISNE
tara:strand:+ start:1677 stop:2840 length:1164 start_codon:yes stop_codon:yes gene_type:complete